MSNKSRTRKHTHPAMSPLLRALTFSHTAHGPVTQAMLLQCYVGLDAFRRGHGSRDLFTTMGRQLLVAEELCLLGYQPDEVANIREALAAMTAIDSSNKQDGIWSMSDFEYAWLCAAFEIFGRQLSAASLDSIAMAETRMVEGLLKAEQTHAIDEALA